MTRVIIVPGLAVRRYAEAAVDELRVRGHTAELLRAPGWRGTPVDVRVYGEQLASALNHQGEPVDVLVGLSIGTQAAAIAAAGSPQVKRLMLVSPTVDPIRRAWLPLLRAWLFGNEGPQAPSISSHLPDWARAGVVRLLLGLRAALRVRIEDELARVSVPVLVAHAQHDPLTTRRWARQLAADSRADFVPLDNQPHSWPYGDEQRFADMIEGICE